MSTAVTAIPRRGRSSSISTRRDREQLVAHHEVVARAQVREQRRRHRRHPRRRDDAVLGALERGDLLLERPVRRVARPRVEVRRRVPGHRPVDRVLLLRRGVEGERRRRVDRRVVRVRDRVRPLARVDRPRREALARPSAPASRPRPRSSGCRAGRRPAASLGSGVAGARRRARSAAYALARGSTNWWTALGRRTPPTTSREVWIPVGLPGFSGDTSSGGRPCSTSGSAPTAGGSGTSSAAGSCRRPSRSSSTRRRTGGSSATARPSSGSSSRSAATSTTTGVENVDEPDDYDQPDTVPNHYQDISVRRVIAELVDDPDWPDVVETRRRDGRHGRPRAPASRTAAAGARLPGQPPAPDPRPAVARLRPQPGRRPGPRPDADHDPPRARRVVPPSRAADTCRSRRSGR